MDRAELERRGFVGWLPLFGLDARSVPKAPGVYAVAYGVGKPARWPEASCGGWYRGNPAVPIDQLDANWVEGAEVVYVGKADCTPSTDLRVRLRAFARFGAGARVSHWGGRLIWQLPDPAALHVGWLETGEADPRSVEAAVIAEFRAAFGNPPFANNPAASGGDGPK